MAKPSQSSLRHRIEARDGMTWIALSGNIDEGADFAPINKLTGPLVIDLGGINRINSLGVREWIHFVRDREAAGIDLTFERCAPVMVGQIGMISNFMGRRSRIRSVLVPYVCPACTTETLGMFEILPGARVPLTVACPKCQQAMELDELPDTYNALVESAVARAS